ncbi:MAG: hypothetical protein QNJ73_14050 [Gammaproteobacteria bacterium]|nr:hypothetical protein [Gammaproteobacteria bacterium]
MKMLCADLSGGAAASIWARGFRWAVLPLTIGLVTACGGGSGVPQTAGVEIPGDMANDRVSITNNDFSLDTRVVYTDEDVPIDADPGTTSVGFQRQGPITLNATSIELRLVREIDPPIVNGEVVQATSISMGRGDRAVVSYNMIGAPRLGAVDYFTRLVWKNPRLNSSVIFKDSDISAVTTDGRWVYAAEATNDPAFPFPSVLERFRIKSNKLILQDNLRVPLTSFAATSAMIADDEIYATSGNTGEVFAFEEDDLTPLGQFPLHDARWVAWDEEGDRIVVAQGTPGQISVFAASQFPGGSMNLLNTFPFPGANVPESKSTVEVVGGKAFIAAGPDGVQIVCLDDGQIVGSVPRPDPASLGLDPSVVVTNAVTVDRDLMFISNGEAGVYVAQGAERFKNSPCSAPQNITMLGKLRFDDLQSVNHVAFKRYYLFIAAGLGGVKVVRVITDDEDDDDDDDDD